MVWTSDLGEETSPITSISWCPENDDYLYYGSWNKTVSLVDSENKKRNNDSIHKITEVVVDAPILDISAKDKNNVFIGTCEKKVYNWNPEKGTTEVFGTHESGVKCVKWREDMGLLITGSWDGHCKIWDIKQGKCVHDIDAGGKIYCFDSKGVTLVAGLSTHQVLNLDLRKTDTSGFDVPTNQIKMQLRSISIFTDLGGYALASIEGRCSLKYFKDSSKDFSFKCHRKVNDVYPVNHIEFHPKYNTFMTIGGDSKYQFWDHGTRQRLFDGETGGKNGCSIATFNKIGDKMAVASSFDFSRGTIGMDSTINDLLVVNDFDKYICPK